ncbi:hypothetical protein HOL24_00285 [bacterium]|jgi:hypothetical protein|nr:hypothetical protein [bacterium]
MSLIKNLALLVASLILSLYLVEIGITVYQTIAGNDVRTKYQVVNDYKGAAVPAVFPSMFLDSNLMHGDMEVLPLAGIANKTTVYCNESGDYSIYESDRYGFNNPDYIWDNVIDVALIGDSFVHGACVESEKSIASQLNLIMHKNTKLFNVLNLGMGGAGPFTELAILKEYAKHAKPKHVFWFFYEGNDMNGLIVEKRSAFLKKYNNNKYTQDLINKQEVIDKVLSKYISNNTHSVLKKNSRMLRLYNTRKLLAPFFAHYSSKPVSSYSGKQLNELRGLLNNAKSLVEGWNGKLYFVYLPSIDRYKEEMVNHVDSLGKNDIINLVKKINIPIIDMHNNFISSGKDPLDFFPNRRQMHYNSDGYRKIAKSINKYLNIANLEQKNEK